MTLCRVLGTGELAMERSDVVTLSCFMVSIIRQQVACRITKIQVVYRFSIVYSTKMTVSHTYVNG